MTGPTTPRLGLPMLVTAQAQKEITHNEALVLIDALIAGRAESAGALTPPASPVPGQCWALGASPTGAWVGKGGQLAIWTEGGWRFCDVGDNFVVRVAGGGCWRRAGAGWLAPGAVAAPTGGTIIDSEARAAIGQLRAALIAAGTASAA